METLTETGVLPLSHNPISPCGFYPKQDSAPPYYFSNQHPNKPGHKTYPRFSQGLEGDSWPSGHNMIQQSLHRYPVETERGEERSDDTGSYISPTNLNTFPQHVSSLHPQIHHSQQHNTSSLPSYSYGHISPLSRGRNQNEDNKKMDDDKTRDGINDLSTFSSQRIKSNLVGSTDCPDFPRPDYSVLPNDSINSPQYNYYSSSIHKRHLSDNQRFINGNQRFIDVRHRSVHYQQDVQNTMTNVKNFYTGDRAGVISYGQSRLQTAAVNNEHMIYGLESETFKTSNELREKNDSSTIHMEAVSLTLTKDQERQSNFSVALNYPTFRREIVSPDDDKPENWSRDRTGVIASHLFSQEKRTIVTPSEGCGSPAKGKHGENDNISSLEDKESATGKYLSSLRSRESDNNSLLQPSPDSNKKLSSESCDEDHQYPNLISSQSQHHASQNDLPSSTKQDLDLNLKSPTQTESRLYASTPKRPDSFPPSVQQRRFSEEEPPSSSWLPLSASSPQPNSKYPINDGFNKVLKEPLNVIGENKDTGSKGSPKPEDSDQKIISSSNMSLSTSPQPVLNKNIDSPTDPSTKLSPFRRLSQEEFSKINSSDEGSLDAKREIFSDEGEDDSAGDDSMSHSPGFSPLHDTSIGYSPQFPHPFFQSQTYGPFSGLRFPFASLQRHHDTGIPGKGFLFGSLPGMSQDMGLMGPMHPSRPSFLGSVPSGLGPARQMTGDKDIYFCHLCSYSGKSKPEFDSHMNTHFEFNCPHCDYTSRTEGRLKRHIKDFHTDDSSRRSIPGRPKVYKCKQCPFSATEKDKFWAHSRTHIKEDKLLQCPKCPFVTEYKHHLEYHLRNHFGSKPFKCPKCNYSCVNKSMLNSHMKSHTNVYQYRCSECTYATKYCHSLKLHLKKYNHKPATVLNQDGSLPQGLDAESSGLSIVSKRGPPRGPRGTRKEKNDPYMSHLFEMPQMPLGVNPVLNSMMPFWPMLPQRGIPGHPPSPHPGFLPGMRNFNQELGIKDNQKEGIDETSDDINENSCGEFKNNLKDKVEICRLCSFVADSREALGLHLMQSHKEVAKEVFLSCGFSEAFLLETFRHDNTDKKLKEQEISELDKDSDSDHSSNDLNQRNSEISNLCKETSEFLQNKSHQMEESIKKSPPSWLSSFSDNQNGGRRLQDLYYSPADQKSQTVDEAYNPSSRLDILQQMTLKFGSGVVPDKQRPGVKEDDLNISKGFKEQQESKKDVVPRFYQTPLDLTKPKSVSPPLISVSPKQDDQHHVNKEGEKIAHYADEGRYHYAEMETIRKRSVTEIEDTSSGMSVSGAEMSLVPPRKRSRKGKAYKLDTLCLKLHKRQTSSSHDEDELETNMEANFHFKPLQSFENEEKSSTRADSSEHEFGKDNDNSENTDEMRAVNEMNKNMTDEVFTGKKSSEVFQDEAEFELQKLQKSLGILVQEINPCNVESADEETHNTDKENVNTIANRDAMNDNYEIGDSAAINKGKKFSDNEDNKETTLTTEPSEKTLEVQLDQVEMINTVLENRKKPVPPEIRRGTELAWKLLNDPVNPVTTLPLPVEASPTTQPSKSSSVSPCSTAKVPDINNASDSKKDVKPQALMSHASQPHLQIPKPHIPNVNHPLTHNPHLLLHPHAIRSTPPSHHPLMPQTLMPMKPPLSIPTPSTPMAYIPPTNRMMTESTLTPQSSRIMSSQKELYECTFCDLSFRDCVMYTVHMGYHSNQNPFQCNSCGVVSRDKVEFFLHIARSPHA